MPATIQTPPITIAYIPHILTRKVAESVGNRAIRILRKRVTIPNNMITRFVFHSSEREQPTIIKRTLLIIAIIAIITIKVVAIRPGKKMAITATISESSPAKKIGNP
jgi:hypothetical protein